MKKILIVLMLLACVVGTASAGGLTYDQANFKKNFSSQGAAGGNNPVFNFIGEIDGMFDGTGTSTLTNLLFDSSITSDPTSTEARIYYNTALNKFKFYDGGSWVTIEAGSTGNSLDGAYDVGRSIFVDAGVLTLTGTDPADNIVLAIVQADTGSTVAQTITSAGTGALLTFTSNGTGVDILGTGGTWTITKAGASTFVGITNTGTMSTTADFTITGTSKNIEFDVSRNSIHLLDDAVLAIGGATTAVGDVTFVHDGSDFLMDAAIASEGWIVGTTSTGFDQDYLFETAGSIFTDYDGDFRTWTDDMDIRFGTGAGTKDGDFKISSDSSNLLTIDVVVAGVGEVAVGNDADDVPWKWYAETTGDWVYYNADEVEFEDVVLQMMDATQVQWGDSDDFFMHATNQAFTFGTLTSDETSAWNFGSDQDGDDVKFFGAAASEFFLWDSSADYLHVVSDKSLFTMTGTTLPFHVNVTGTVSGNAVQLETTDGGIQLLADGAVNGDITLDAEDDIILITTGSLTITNTDAMTVSGAFTVAGITTLNGTLVGDGATTVVGTIALLEAYTGADNVLTISESGSVFTNTGDADGSLHTLPEASTALGMSFTFVVTVAQTMTINPKDGIDQIQGLTNAAGDAISSAAVGDSITLTSVDADIWAVTACNNSNGNADAWVDAN